MDDLVLYDSRCLTTHAVIIGMTRSGKTGLGISILEEAAIAAKAKKYSGNGHLEKAWQENRRSFQQKRGRIHLIAF